MKLQVVLAQLYFQAVLITGDELVHLKALGKYVASFLDMLEMELISAKGKEGKYNHISPHFTFTYTI